MSSTRTHSPVDDPAINDLEEDIAVDHVSDEEVNNPADISDLNIKEETVAAKDPAPKENGVNEKPQDDTTNELVARNLELDKLRRELRVKNDSEEQMRQVSISVT